jgi:hypothetical protein
VSRTSVEWIAAAPLALGSKSEGFLAGHIAVSRYAKARTSMGWRAQDAIRAAVDLPVTCSFWQSPICYPPKFYGSVALHSLGWV